MVTIFRLMLLGALSIAVTACTETNGNVSGVDPNVIDDGYLYAVDVDAARAMQPQGPPFSQGLRAGYFAYVDRLNQGFDLPAISHFSRKAVASAEGLNVQPDMLSYYRGLPKASADELAAARARLVSAFEAGGRSSDAADAARAQVAFDCWLRETAKGDAAGMSRCKGEFEDAIGKVESSLAKPASTYIVFFAWDRADITPVAQQILEQVANDFKAGKSPTLVLGGYTDTSGPAPYNLQLSERRAKSVAAALAKLGVSSDAMKVSWYGETHLRVQTKDGVREPQNRRVEINFQ
jgi:OOP family OmpA-OmpF porin